MPRSLRHLLLAAAVISLGGLTPAAVRGHGIESSLNYLSGSLELSSGFSTGEPAQGAIVRLLQADGSPGQQLGRMDANGKLTLTLPALVDGEVDLQVDGGPGHRDYLTLPIRKGQVQIDAVSQAPLSSRQWLAQLGGAGLLGGAGAGISLALLGRVRRLRQG